MRVLRVFVPAAFLFAAVLIYPEVILPARDGGSRQVYVMTFRGTINPASADYIVRGISAAEKDRAQAVVIRLNTPGGMMEAMEKIVRKELAAKIPIIVYIAPSGAKAASAGTMITMAANVAAMAPGTSLGAAHPVSALGEKMDKASTQKVVNYAAKYIRSIAEVRGRNADWAESTVRENATLDYTKAVDKKAVDLIARNLGDLLRRIDGRRVVTAAGEVTLRTANAPTHNIDMSAREQFLNVLSDPNFFFILILIATYGIIFELSNPGAILPGVVGGIALIMLLYAMSVLPVSAAGIALIVLSVILFIVDLNVPTHGILTAGGIISFMLGAFMLFDISSPVFRVSAVVIVGGALITALFFSFLLRLGVKAQKNKIVSGAQGLIGKMGEARTKLDPVGQVFADGTYWVAVTEEGGIKPGDKVKIVGMEGLKVKVVREETG